MIKKFVKYGLGGLVAVLVLGAAGFYYWTRSALARPASDALAALNSNGRVAIDDGAFVVFRPAGSEPTMGLM